MFKADLDVDKQMLRHFSLTAFAKLISGEQANSETLLSVSCFEPV